MAKSLRKLVSKAKRRTVDSSIPDGEIDLDLSEIHPRIVCMGFPASGIMSFYRNPYTDVIRYLDHHYGEFYMVYNLCEEKEYQYKSNKFHGRVRLFPFKDHEACPLHLIPSFVEDSMSFLEADARNVVVIHCKAGKGRTGVFACCLLLSLEKNVFSNAQEVMEFYGYKRTINGQGLTVPSQRRYVQYYAELLTSHNGHLPDSVTEVWWKGFTLIDFPKSLLITKVIVYTDNPYVATTFMLQKRNNSQIEFEYDIRSLRKEMSNGSVVNSYNISFDKNCKLSRISGDVKITLLSSTEIVGVLSVNTLFLERVYSAKDIDKLCKHKKLYGSSCAIEFDYEIIRE